MTMRIAAAADAPDLSDLHRASFSEGWSSRDFETWLSRPEGFAVLSTREREAVAFGLALAAGDDAELLAIATRPETRRGGLAREILHALDAEAQARGLKRWVLEVARNNLAAAGLYKSAGFVEIGVRKAYYPHGEGRVDALVLVGPVGLLSGHRGARPAYVPGVPADPGRPDGGRPMIEQRCVEKGLRMTEQRRVIARVLSTAADHPDAEELHRRAASIDPNISLATVYRTVKLFEDSGIIERHDFRDGRSRYEEAPEEHHDHLIDAKSGRVVEFKSDEIEKLQIEIARKLGYRLVDHRLELYGVPLDEEKK
jgi:Fur family transcriptional regulator, ferric uptake regulator